MQTSLEPAPTVLGGEREYTEFIGSVIFGQHLARIPDAGLRDAFVTALAGEAKKDDPPWSLDYWRLNLEGTAPGR